MPAINLPFNIINGAPLDADQVMANEGTIVSAINGNLEMGSNVSNAAPSAPIKGYTTSEGVSASALRSDAQFTVQGFEHASSDPSSGNFIGREYFNTVTKEKRLCIATAGAGTWVTTGNPTADELVHHAANHTDGESDELENNSIAQRMMIHRTIHSATLTSPVTSISSSSFNTIIDLTGVNTTAAQTLGVWVSLLLSAGPNSATHNAAFRVIDVTDSNTTIYCSCEVQLDLGVQTQLSGFFYYNTPSGGNRTLRVQAGVTSGNDCDVKAQTGFNTETLDTPTIQAVIL